MKTIIYLRKSTDDSKHQKASIEDQRKWADEYVRTSTKGIEVVKVFEEKKTAKQPWRPMFNEMMGMFYSGKADAIVTWDIDRLSRNEVDEGTIKWAIRQGKIKEVHTHNSIYTEHELLTMGIFLSLGAEEIAKMRQRVMRRMNSMITEGKVPYLAPYGYSNKDGGAIVNHEEANTLKKIFELRANGYSFGQVADYLNDKGIKSRWRSANSVGKWGSSNVEGIIKNEFYVGVVKFAGQIGEGVHDRIISRDLWDQVNAERRTNVGYKKHDFPLKGIVVNSEGQPLKASLIKGRYVYYHDDKSKIYISQKEIFKELEPLVSKWVFPTEVQIELEKIIRNEINQEYEATIFELNESKKLKSENEAKLSRLINLYSIGGITDVEYQKARLELLAIKSKLDDEENGFTALELSLVEKFNTLVKLLGNLSVAYKTGDDIQRGLILRSALVKLEIDSEKRLQVQQKEVFEDLFKLVECIWLPWDSERQTDQDQPSNGDQTNQANLQMKLKELYFALCRGYREIVDFLKEPYVPINPEESIFKKEKKERPAKKERKKFPRDEAKKLFLAGSSYAEIGRGYGISRVAVWRALNKINPQS